jgi:hypothetical protein
MTKKARRATIINELNRAVAYGIQQMAVEIARQGVDHYAIKQALREFNGIRTLTALRRATVINELNAPLLRSIYRSRA